METDMTMNYKPYITRDPRICGGEPVVTGTRVTVRTILASLAEGMTVEDLLRDFPRLTDEAITSVTLDRAWGIAQDFPDRPSDLRLED
jgi:uncharacterized protein (DUF433 family)